MIETLRHDSVFSSHRFGDKRIDIIGAGATGSKICSSLYKLGINNIHVWDFDHIVEHNIANQAFKKSQVGMQKVDALRDICSENLGDSIGFFDGKFHNEKVDGSQKIGPIVFLLTDTMKSRKEIWDKSLKMKGDVKLLIETRMGIDEGRIYTVIPFLPPHVVEYEKTLYNDEETPVSACGANPSVGPTADIVSGMAVWQMIKWFNQQEGRDEDIDNEIIFSLRPNIILSRKF